MVGPLEGEVGLYLLSRGSWNERVRRPASHIAFFPPQDVCELALPLLIYGVKGAMKCSVLLPFSQGLSGAAPATHPGPGVPVQAEQGAGWAILARPLQIAQDQAVQIAASQKKAEALVSPRQCDPGFSDTFRVGSHFWK